MPDGSNSNSEIIAQIKGYLSYVQEIPRLQERVKALSEDIAELKAGQDRIRRWIDGNGTPGIRTVLAMLEDSFRDLKREREQRRKDRVQICAALITALTALLATLIPTLIGMV